MKKVLNRICIASLLGFSVLFSYACTGAANTPEVTEPSDIEKEIKTVQAENSNQSSSNINYLREYHEFLENQPDYDVLYAGNEAYKYYCEHNPDLLVSDPEFANKPQGTLTYEDVVRISNESDNFIEFLASIQEIQLYPEYVYYPYESNAIVPDLPGGFDIVYYVKGNDGTKVSVSITFGGVVCSVIPTDGSNYAPMIFHRFFSIENQTQESTVDNSQADVSDALTSSASEQQSKSESSKAEGTAQTTEDSLDTDTPLNNTPVHDDSDTLSKLKDYSNAQETLKQNTEKFEAIRSRMMQKYGYAKWGQETGLLELLFIDYPDLSDEKYNEIIQSNIAKGGSCRYSHDEAVILGLRSADEPNITLDEVRSICAKAAEIDGYERNKYICNEMNKIHLPEIVTTNDFIERIYKLDPDGELNREISITTFARVDDIDITYYTYNNGESRYGNHLKEETIFTTIEQ